MRKVKPKKYLFGQKGFTLVETMFVTLLFPMLFLSIYSVLDISNTIFYTNSVYSQLNYNAMQTLRFISREIGQTSPLATPSHLNITTDASGNSVIRFQIPVDWDNDGDIVTGSNIPQVEWGAYDYAGQTQNGRLSGWVRYSVVNNQLIREVLDVTLTPVSIPGGAPLRDVVANNVQSFVVAQMLNAAQMTLALSQTDNMSHTSAAGAKRVLQSTLTSRTILRNSVN